MPDDSLARSNNADLISAIERLSGTINLPLAGTPPEGAAIILPSGKTIKSLKPLLDEFRTAPERRKGKTVFRDIASFIAFIQRYQHPDTTVVFGRRAEEAPLMHAVFDYHPGGPDNTAAAFAEFSATYQFPLARQWKTWASVDGKWLSQRDFAEFIEDNIMDVQPAPRDGRSDASALTLDLLERLKATVAGPSEIVELTRGLRIAVNHQVVQVVNISTGETEITFKSEHKNAAGQPIRVPNLFVIGIPVFDRDVPYALPVRLRYDKIDEEIRWKLQRYRADLVFFDAVDRAMAQVKEQTGMSVLIGEPT